MENWILALAASPLVYLGMYLFATIDGFFPPIPSESLAIALAALSVTSGQPNLALIILVAAMGAFTGDQIAYTIGKWLDVRRIPFMGGPRGQKTLSWARRSPARRGASVILAGRFIPVGRVAVNVTAGAVGYPRRRFVGFDAIASVLRRDRHWGRCLVQGPPPPCGVVGLAGGLLIGLVLDCALRRLEYLRNPAADPASIQTAPAAGPDEAENE